jgi:hypothetical protein
MLRRRVAWKRRVAWTSRDLALWLLAKFGIGGWTLGVVKKARFTPRTIVDVGAGRGTPHLYEAFPEAYHLLVEPLMEYESDLRKALQPYQGEYIFTAAGATNTRAFINVERRPMMSSFLEQTRTADLISLRVIGRVLLGLAGVCNSRISRAFSLLRLAPCCTVLRSRWYQSGIRSRSMALLRSPCNRD